ncbi:hypothetical protein FRC04_006171 [Tulasnella sp. 424]|nr:hypothetical protein FRC04_006171 [Tulasnella sp. 424]
MQTRKPQAGPTPLTSTAGAGPSSAHGSATWHPCIESDMYHIVHRHAASPETVQTRRAILATLQDATSSITSWRVIDASPWTYSFETEESVLQVALAQQTDDPKLLGGTPLHVAPPEHGRTKRSSRKSPDLRPLESVIQGISPLLQIQASSEGKLPDPVECTIAGTEFDLLPPSPFHAPLNALLNAYRWHYQPLYALFPFFDLWLRSWDVEPDEFSPACLALLVLTYLRTEYGLDDLQKMTPYEPRSGHAVDDANTFLKAAKNGKIGSYQLSQRLEHAPAGEVIYGFFKFLSDGKITKRVMSVRAQPLPLREHHESLDPTLQAASHKPPLFVQDPFLPFYNHASNLSSSTWSRLQSGLKRTIAELEATAPLHCIFGPAVEAVQSSPPAQPFLDPLIEVVIQRMISSQAPDASILAARQRTIVTVDQVIRSTFGEKYLVQCFGSTQYGVDSATSDLDMIILDPDLGRGWHPSVKSEDLPAVYNMKKVGWALQDGGFQRVIAITGATVPIVKFYDPRTRLNIDLNCNNALGCVNTVLLANYCNAWAPLRSMIFFIKKWAKSWAFNDASGQDGPSSYSSYCLTLMIVAFLQTRGVLPNLQSNAVGQLDKETAGFWLKLKKDKRLWTDTRFESLAVYQKRGWKGRSMALGDALYGWFRFFAYEFKYDTHVLDIKKGGLDRRRELMVDERDPKSKTKVEEKSAGQATGQDAVEEDGAALANDVNDVAAADPAVDAEPADWKQSKFVVVDPFISTKNCANGVSLRVNERFIQECQRAVSLLEAGQPVDSLLGEQLPLFPGEGKPRRPPLRYLQPKKRKSNARGPASPTSTSISQTSAGSMQQQRSTTSGFPDPTASSISLAEFLERMRLNRSTTPATPSARRQPPTTTNHQPKSFDEQINDVYYPALPWLQDSQSTGRQPQSVTAETSGMSVVYPQTGGGVEWQSSTSRPAHRPKSVAESVNDLHYPSRIWSKAQQSITRQPPKESSGHTVGNRTFG